VNVLTRLAAAVTGVGLLGLAMWFYTIQPELRAHATDPIRTTGTMGEEVVNPVFSLKAERVDVARSLKTSSSLLARPDIGTDGVFVIVHLRVKSNSEPFRLQSPHLETPGGYRYGSADRIGLSDAVASSYEPLIWDDAVLTFEIPPGRLAGARLVVGEFRLLRQLSAETAVDLGIDRAEAARLVRAAPEGYELRRSGP
jgi:hypothetical protein